MHPAAAALVSLPAKDETYQMPYVLVCSHHGEGCGFENESTDQCAADAYKNGFAVFNNTLHVEDIVVESQARFLMSFSLA